MAATDDPRTDPADETAARPRPAPGDDATSEGHSMLQGGPDPRTMRRERRREVEQDGVGRRIHDRDRDR